jgi:chorismate mutase
MAEVIYPEFGKRKPSQINEPAPEEKGQNLFFGLSAKAQERIKLLLKRVGDSKYVNHISVEDEDIEKQRVVLRNWTSEETIKFIENQTNESVLQSKPALVMALFEKLTGKI